MPLDTVIELIVTAARAHAYNEGGKLLASVRAKNAPTAKEGG